ncbi:MAG TPA: TAXI family TRAP transporter solute-binding subunit [Rhodocyclaceae bacterium]
MPRNLTRAKALERLRRASWRDLLLIGLPALLLLIGGFWVTAQFVKPAPPKQLVLASGGSGGGYQRYAAEFKRVLARQGIEVVERPSSGALENQSLLQNENSGVDAAFMQGGTARLTGEEEGLYSLGALYHEPLWVFYRTDAARNGALDRISQLRGKRIAIGASGSGTRALAQEILGANGMDKDAVTLVDIGGMAAAMALSEHKVDAVFLVGPVQSASVWTLLYTDGVRPMSLSHAEAYTRQFPYLAHITLPKGAVDLVRNIPEQDVELVSPMATLVVRDSTHPAQVDLLLQAASELYGGPGIFQRAGDFPKSVSVDYPLAPAAERYYKSGKPLLQRYLPFWAATLVDRLVVMLIPLFALVIPVAKFAPALYGWRVRSRIYRRYGELKFLEADFEAEPERHSPEEWLRKLEVIENDVARLATPLAFVDMLYTLRGHIEIVRAAILRRKG